jgi:pimeloyl-ACP methyl ester carboxylesterase
LPFEHSSWQPLVEELGISALSPDLPGMGRSGHGAPTGEWLGELLDRAGLDSVTLVSHSLGCVPAMELAVRSPERVRGLVLISPFFAQARAGWILRCSMSGRVLLNAVSEDRLERSLFTSRNPSTARAVEAAKRSLTRNGVPANVARLLATASGVAERKRLRSLADRIRVPTLVVHGSDDLLRYPLPFRTHAVVGAGHAPHLEAAARVAAIIRRLDTGRVTVPGVAEEHR